MFAARKGGFLDFTGKGSCSRVRSTPRSSPADTSAPQTSRTLLEPVGLHHDSDALSDRGSAVNRKSTQSISKREI